MLSSFSRSQKFAFLLVIGGSLMVVSVLVLALIVLGLAKAVSTRTAEYGTFASCTELADWLNAYDDYYYYGGGIVEDSAGEGRAPAMGGDKSVDYSQTNVQVAGVDEADVVKTDGEYIYAVVQGYTVKKVVILEVESLKTVAAITLDVLPSNIFVSGDTLVVFAPSGFGRTPLYDTTEKIAPDYQLNQAKVLIYNIADRAKPSLEKTVVYEGTYQTARLIDNVVYVVNDYWPSYFYTTDLTPDKAEELIPRYAVLEGKKTTVESDDMLPLATCDEIAHYGEQGRNFSHVLTVDLESDALGKKVLVGNSQTVYMSENNLYLTSVVYNQEDPAVPCDPWHQALGMCMPSATMPMMYYNPQTDIFKISVDGTAIAFDASGRVEGTLLNQFSLDEHSGMLRVATTTSALWGQSDGNNMYVLDENLSLIGALEGVAEDEQIYSVRFMGDRAYMVTFRQTDPLFVVDLSLPRNPKLLGELKIPGFSNYLHPYDENHILGFGKEVNATTGSVEGVKVGLFNVEDPANPEELDKLLLGGRGSDSELLYDHKALLFDREKDLLVFPVTLYNNRLGSNKPYYESANGFVAVSVDVTSGLDLRKFLETEPDPIYYYGTSRRALYVGDKLYTLDRGDLNVYNLESLAKIAEVELIDTPEPEDYFFP